MSFTRQIQRSGHKAAKYLEYNAIKAIIFQETENLLSATRMADFVFYLLRSFNLLITNWRKI